MSAVHVTIPLDEREADALIALAAFNDMTPGQVLRQALRLYHDAHVRRMQRGEELAFTKDGVLVPKEPPPGCPAFTDPSGLATPSPATLESLPE